MSDEPSTKSTSKTRRIRGKRTPQRKRPGGYFRDLKGLNVPLDVVLCIGHIAGAFMLMAHMII